MQGRSDLVGLVEQRGAVHLAGKADALDRGDLLGLILGAAPSSTRSQAVHQLSGSCSDQPGCGRETFERRGAAGDDLLALSSISTALTEDVPISRPRYIPWAFPRRVRLYGTLSRTKMSMRMRSWPAIDGERLRARR